MRTEGKAASAEGTEMGSLAKCGAGNEARCASRLGHPLPGISAGGTGEPEGGGGAGANRATGETSALWGAPQVLGTREPWGPPAGGLSFPV